jgi:hypothetical protein
MFESSALVALVNWTMLTGMTRIFEQLLAHVMPRLQNRNWMFFDLADPAKRTREDIGTAIDLIARFQPHAKVILGLNLQEGRQIGEVLGFPSCEENHEAVAAHAAKIREKLGVETVVWLGDGVFMDETDGHVDNLACFTAPGEVALTWTDDRRDPMYPIVRDAEARLRTARDARGRKFKLHKLVQPGPLHMTAEEARGVDACEGTKPRQPGERLAASYVNFYIANRHVVMPLLDAKRDAAAAAVLKRCFPTRTVVGVPAREILLGGGNIHCITQQVPAGK